MQPPGCLSQPCVSAGRCPALGTAGEARRATGRAVSSGPWGRPGLFGARSRAAAAAQVRGGGAAGVDGHGPGRACDPSRREELRRRGGDSAGLGCLCVPAVLGLSGASAHARAGGRGGEGGERRAERGAGGGGRPRDPQTPAWAAASGRALKPRSHAGAPGMKLLQPRVRPGHRGRGGQDARTDPAPRPGRGAGGAAQPRGPCGEG